MKNTMKRLMAVLLAGIMLFAFAGCSPTKKAEKAVKSFLDATASLDIEKAKGYINGGDEDELVFNEDIMLFGNELFGKMSYEIKETEEVDENTVNVIVEITNIDMKPVLGEFLRKALEFAFSNAYTEDITEEEIEENYVRILSECLSEENLEMKTMEATVRVVLVDGEWKVEVDGEFMNAVLGGLGDATEEIQSAM